MRHARHLATVLLLVLLTACGTEPLAVPLPDADGGLAAAAVYVHDPAGGVAFLPPVGADVDTRAFYPGASLTIKITDRATKKELHVMSSSDGTVRVEDDFYLALWRVSDTVAATPPAVTRVRVSVYASDLGAATVAEACAAAPEDPCLLAYFDAAIRRSRGERTGGDVMDLTRARTLPIKMYLQGPGLRPERLSELLRLSDGLPFDDTEIRNCVVNEFTMPGQGLNALGAGLNALGAGLNALGAVGGMFLFEPGADSTAPSIRIFDPAEAATRAAALVGPSEGFEDAAILVVDDFGAEGAFDAVLALDPALLSPADDLSEAGLAALIAGGGFSHGALVLHQVVAMVEAAGFLPVADPWGGWFRVYARPVWDVVDGQEVQVPGRDYLVVAAVDTRDYAENVVETDLVAPRIRNALNALRYFSELDSETEADDGFDVLRVAINMSFVIVPCAVFEDYEDAPAGFGIETFEDYVAALGAENAVAEDFYDELTTLLLEPLGGGDEPLLQEIESCTINEEEPVLFGLAGDAGFAPMDIPYEPPFFDNTGDWRTLVEYPEEFGEGYGASWPCPDGETSPSVVYVASSGNFGLDYPMYPAAWPLVVGVSSQDGAEPDGFAAAKSSFSNSGEVMAPGALFELGRSSATNPERVLAYAGTSFAAPVASLFTALDQMAPSPACALATTSRLTFSADTGNLELGTAVSANCGQLN